ncbi:NDxxF motif lipoprotein [Bacillus norwichensis]|uniref:NDxxF motif lipoprotein n=1 Tax=Bacillus norwichensis TaxID=2762217 RepID=A0ABR8VQ91_9BACI|nr:NDxxF motif lipoprotein [Bacillus norwichensis]MBD8006877.1 NDxxF motif lipoprotein [Bacillus norwichensis]
MRKIFYSIFIIFVLSACSGEENIDTTEEDETPLTTNIEIPSTIFTSEKNNSTIEEEEMKLSIKTYLDSSEELDNAIYPFEEILDADEELNKSELEKFHGINKLIKENDENFSNYILNNTLPEGYQEESERISRYITASNEYIQELNQMLDNVSEGNFSEIDVGSLIDKSGVVNGKEQKKIEDFLDKKKIQTKAFGRE